MSWASKYKKTWKSSRWCLLSWVWTHPLELVNNIIKVSCPADPKPCLEIEKEYNKHTQKLGVIMKQQQIFLWRFQMDRVLLCQRFPDDVKSGNAGNLPKPNLEGKGRNQPNRSSIHVGKRATLGNAWSAPVQYPLKFFPPFCAL